MSVKLQSFQRTLVQVEDEDLLDILRDDSGTLAERIRAIRQDTLRAKATEELEECTASGTDVEADYFSGEYEAEAAGLKGIYLNFYRKGNHQDFNSARIETPWGARNLGYSVNGHHVGDLFRKGTYTVKVKVRRPIWIGIGKVTFHSRCELAFSTNWNPSGVRWWGECWGWYGIGFSESVLCEWKIKVTLR